MATKVLSISNKNAFSFAQEVLASGGLIAFPTDTIYGIAVSVWNEQAIEKIYQIKGRSLDKAIPVLIGEYDQVSTIASEVNQAAKRLISELWPGALTVIVKKKTTLPENLSIYPTIGVRMPDLVFTLNLLKICGPLATTSANLSGGMNTQTAEQVMEQLDGRIDLLLDGGSTPGLISSTVVDCSQDQIKILRKGGISSEKIQSIAAK